MIQLDNITREFPAPGGDPLRVLDGITLDIAKGESLAVVGPSGCGKSTLLNIIGGLDKPTRGEVILDGQNLTGLKEAELARLRNRRIGFVFQLHHLLPQCTVLENVLVPTLAGEDDASYADRKTRAMDLLETVGLADFRDYAPGQLSGGQRQRVAVARALINEPAVLLADEPTGSLDAKASEDVAALIERLNTQKELTVILVTHSRELARRMARVLCLENGRLSEEQ